MTEGRVLVVDDEDANRRLVRRVLEPQGYTVFEASDGIEAEASVVADPPDVVLLDIQMPRMDGYATLKKLKGSPSTRLVPVVMLTSLEELKDRVAALKMGADDYLNKPFLADELIARVGSLVSLKRFTDELEHATQVLDSISILVEQRDSYTGHHCARVGRHARLIGESLGLGKEDLSALTLAGSYHDLGKIAVSDSVLRKPGRLTPEEFDSIKTHAAIGADIIKPMKTMSRVVPVVRHHHERLDGSGYPDHLSGREIPITVRILSVADIYDALATKRPYKEALPHDVCLKILREEAAKGWWDREVVETLARVLSQGAIG